MSLTLERAQAWRKAIAELPQEQHKEGIEPPQLKDVVVPSRHMQSLSLDSTLIEGMRGAGKSFWTSVLCNREAREFVAGQTKNSLLTRTYVGVGCSTDLRGYFHPSFSMIDQLINRNNLSPSDVWMHIIKHNIKMALSDNPNPEGQDWEKVVAKIDKVSFEKEMVKYDESLKQKDKYCLIVFDSLDRLSIRWEDVRSRVKALMEIVLHIRSLSRIKFKIFLRPDMLEDSRIWEFQDSSKLKHSKVQLSWEPDDLYAILIGWLANHASEGDSFRTYCQEVKVHQFESIEGIYVAKDAGKSIRDTIESITGKTMGAGHKKGYCYTWIPLHLADANSSVSPRSFLMAMKQAAQVTLDKYPLHAFPLHSEGIKSGVISASENRVDELKEDYPWIPDLLNAFSGMTVYLSVEDIEKKWKGRLDSVLTTDRLPPLRFSQAHESKRKFREQVGELIEDVVSLGVMNRASDGRINIPDIYRIGYNIGRKGGVALPRK